MNLSQQIDEMNIIILGGEDWIERARDKAIKRSPDAIERREHRLVVQKAILDTLMRLQREATKFDGVA